MDNKHTFKHSAASAAAAATYTPLWLPKELLAQKRPLVVELEEIPQLTAQYQVNYR